LAASPSYCGFFCILLPQHRQRGDELPKELQRRQDRLDAFRKAMSSLEAQAAADHARCREQQARPT